VRNTHQRALIVAGEVSGDIHAANLLESLRELIPDLEAFGVGGERLAEAGFEALAHTEELAHMGLFEVLRELPRIRRVLNRLVAVARDRAPAVAVLLDSPDFNLRLAARLRSLGTPVVLYISPQLWAWRRGRVRVVRRVAREVLCILPFEPSFYTQHGVVARYVGHPLVDDLARDGLLDVDVQADPRRVGLLPGSRAMEVRQLLPTMLDTLERLPREVVDDAVLVEAPGVGQTIDAVLDTRDRDGRLRRVSGAGRRGELAGCALAWTASGTATLECALLGVPMVVGYRLQPLSYGLAKLLVRVPHVALANLIAGKRVAPELIQRDWRPSLLEQETRHLLGSGGASQRTGLIEVRQRLGGAGASRRAAAAVAEHLGLPRGPAGKSHTAENRE